jgi:hypothetical protein
MDFRTLRSQYCDGPIPEAVDRALVLRDPLLTEALENLLWVSAAELDENGEFIHGALSAEAVTAAEREVLEVLEEAEARLGAAIQYGRALAEAEFEALVEESPCFLWSHRSHPCPEFLIGLAVYLGIEVNELGQSAVALASRAASDTWDKLVEEN